MIPRITLSRALSDINLLGAPFQAPSFWTWKTVARLIDGESLRDQRDINLFRECTGRMQLPATPVRPADCSCWQTRRQRPVYERGRGMAGCTLRRLAKALQCWRTVGGPAAWRRPQASRDPSGAIVKGF